MKNSLSLFRSLLVAGMLVLGMSAHAGVVSGTVTDQTGETIISASVVVKGTTIGTVTDFDGNYELDVPADAVLVFSYIGLVSQEIPVAGQSVINVVLKENAEVLDEVVVTGYGTTKKRDLVTSVASVSADALKDVPVSSAAEALQGKLAGVSVTTSEGSPDADVKIRVRGGTSLTQSSEPLYIVDGFPVSSIKDIAPGDIQSMDVLKDAAATAIYGAQGANGVIIITTKDIKTDGDKFKWNVDYNGYMGWKRIAKKYKMMNGEDYLRMQYEFAYTDAKCMNGSALGADKLSSNFFKFYDPTYVEDTKSHGTLGSVIDYWNGIGDDDWQEATFGGNHLTSNHTVSVSGGVKKANFNLNYNRIDDNSIMYGSNYVRNNASLKAKFQPVKGLTISATVRFTNTDVLGSGTNPADDSGSKGESRLRNATSFVPLHGIEDKLKDLEDDTDLGNLYNPIIAINDNYKRKVDNKLNTNGYIQYKFLKNFTVRAEAGYETRRVLKDNYYGPTTSFARTGDGNAQVGEGFGHGIVDDYRTSRFKETNTFEYAQKFNDNAHDFSVLIGEEQTITKGNRMTYKGYGYDPNMSGPDVFKNFDQYQKADTINYIDPTDNMISFFARANYNYKGRYYVTATFRADGSSRFTKGNQWGFFPSVAVAWRMIDEPWMEKATDVMSNFKFRLSYGTVGNNNVDLGYLHFDYLTYPASYMQGMSTVVYDGGASRIAANSNLKWETTVTRDFGLDYGFFNERLSGAIDLYWNTTKDLILKYKLATGGYNYQFRNIGSTDNKGVEFSIRGVILDKHTKDLSYGLTADFNISHNANKVISLGGLDEYPVSAECFSTYYTQGYEYNLKVGEAVGDIYGYQTDGIWKASDFASYNSTLNAWLDANGKEISTPLGNAYPGMSKIVSEKDTLDRDVYNLKVLGNVNAVVSGGFNLSAFVGGDKWGNVDFSASFAYSVGNKLVNMTALDYSTVCNSTKNRNLLASNGYAYRYSLFDEAGNFMPIDGTNSKVISGDEFSAMAARIDEANEGKTTANPIVSNPVLTDKYLEDASYLRLNNLTVAYTLPERLTTKAHISKCRFYFTGSNLFCATKYSGLDPEVDTRSKVNPLAIGMDFAAFPKNRGFNFGVNLTFE